MVSATPAGDPTPGDDLPPDVIEALDPRLQMARWERWLLVYKTGFAIVDKVIEGFLGRRRYQTIAYLLLALFALRMLGH
ncbi:hypothetical protein NE235_35825 [Actinoallomurus spadix]|uniref:Transposase n=1 Tax=Actinoallomurus spadix TaxID=79912 RepID=A0ABN0WLS1_9ACTN|nr:hypothetical protein [Actinoallomurus spadix]MCO5991498.1 hypothetical protein [Actinoallomurus spadix]